MSYKNKKFINASDVKKKSLYIQYFQYLFKYLIKIIQKQNLFLYIKNYADAFAFVSEEQTYYFKYN